MNRVPFLLASCFSAPLRLCVFALTRASRVLGIVWISLFTLANAAFAELPTPTLTSPFVALDLSVGELQEVTLANDQKVVVKLVDVKDFRDTLRGAVRRSEVSVEVGGKPVMLGSATYHLPVKVG